MTFACLLRGARFALLTCVFALTVLSANAAYAFEERTFDTPKDESLYHNLITELRCLVCQNQNIADSDADLAVDLRREIYAMIQADKNKSEILDFMVQRYGEFVLYKPRFSPRTVVLWLAPALLLLLGGAILWRSTVNAKNPADEDAASSPDSAALARARSLLEDD